MAKPKMPYILFWPETNLDIIVKSLQSMKNDQYNYYFDFLGHNLESDTVTLEDAYLEVYGMSREEYRKKLKESYEAYKNHLSEQFRIHREENELRKQKIHDIAKGVIPEDKMPIFEEAYEILCIRHPLSETIQLEFVEFIKYLNSSEFSLQEALAKYKRFIPRLTISNYDLLRCIKELSVHGSELYDILADEESVKRVKETIQTYQIAHNLDTLPGFKLPEPTEDELLTSYDIKRTTYALLGYSLSQNKDPEGMGLK